MSSSGIELKGDFLNLLAFLVTSARGCVDEPKLYGPFRLIDGASRLIGILEEAHMADEFLVEIKRKMDEGKYKYLTDAMDKFAFIQFLDDLTLDFVDKLKANGKS